MWAAPPPPCCDRLRVRLLRPPSTADRLLSSHCRCMTLWMYVGAHKKGVADVPPWFLLPALSPHSSLSWKNRLCLYTIWLNSLKLLSNPFKLQQIFFLDTVYEQTIYCYNLNAKLCGKNEMLGANNSIIDLCETQLTKHDPVLCF